MTDQGETAEDILGVTEENDPDETALLEAEKYWNSLNDPLQTYLKDVKRHPLLVEEEKQKLLKKYRESGDQEAKEMLVNSNLRLVVKIAFQYQKYTHIPTIDLIQEGNTGLIKAVEKYDPAKRTKLSYYSSIWIKGYIMNYIMKNWGLVKTLTTENKRKLFMQLKREKRRLSKEGIDPTAKKIADNLNVQIKDVLDMEGIFGGGEVSLDQPLSSEEGSNARIDFMPSKTNPEKLVFDKEIKEKGQAIFARFRETLSPRELFIFDSRICCEEALNLEELGNKLNLSRERVRQIEKEIYEKIYKFNKFKAKEAIMSARKFHNKTEELTDVTLDEVRAITRPKTKSREVAILYFGLKDHREGLRPEDIAEQTGISRNSVSSYISQARSKIRTLRGKQGYGKENTDPSPEENNRTEPNPDKSETNPVSRQNDQDTVAKQTPDQTEEKDDTEKNNPGEPIHLFVQKGSEKFEMKIPPGGIIHDFLVRYLGL